MSTPFQPLWELQPRDELCILNNATEWLLEFVSWLGDPHNWNDSKESLYHFLTRTRDMKAFFLGLGKYTSSEIFASAGELTIRSSAVVDLRMASGIHPLWRPREVFGVPSRLVRLILAYADYVYTASSKAKYVYSPVATSLLNGLVPFTHVRSCLIGCRQGWTVFQNDDLRCAYYATLRIYGKLRTRESPTVKAIIKQNEVDMHLQHRCD